MLFGGKHYGKHSITQAHGDNLTAMFNSVILLQIVMVSPGTHLVSKSLILWVPLQNHEVPVQKTTIPKLKMLRPLCDQIDKRYMYSFVKHNKTKRNIHRVVKQPQKQPQKSHEQDILQKHLQMDWSINLCILRDACHELVRVFGDFYASRTQDAKSLYFIEK